jgi:hypothetical protein
MPARFSAAGKPTVATGIQQWVSGFQQLPPGETLSSETARLKRIGFVAAATLNLNGAGGGGVSLVEQFRSAVGPRSELAGAVASDNGGSGVVTFHVPGIPHVVGFGGVGADQGVNVAFADGNYYYYLVGEQASTPANRAAVIASAQKLYHRVNG